MQGNAPNSTNGQSATLYRFYSRDHELLYVGITINLVQRWHEHASNREWWRLVAHAKLEHFDTRDEAEVAERRAIAAEKPRWNITHNSVSPLVPKPQPVPVDTSMEDTWLTAGVAAERLHVSSSVVHRALESGQLSGGKTPGGHRRVSGESVKRLFREMYPDEAPPTETS